MTNASTTADTRFDRLEELISDYFAEVPVKFGENDKYVRYYVISTGFKNAQLTLNSFNTIRMHKPDQYITNLSNDPEKCFAKLKTLVSKDEHIMIDRINENDRAKSFRILNFGKYKDMHIEEVIKQDISYAVWLYEKAMSKSKNLWIAYEDMLTAGRYEEAERQARISGNWDCIETKLDKALMSEYKEQLEAAFIVERAKREAKYKEQQEEKMKNVAKIVDGRQEITAKIVKRKTYNNDFGFSVKYILETADGNRFYGSLPKKMWRDDILQEMNIEFTITATVTAKEDHFAFFKRPTISKEELQRIDDVILNAETEQYDREVREAVEAEKKRQNELNELRSFLMNLARTSVGKTDDEIFDAFERIQKLDSENVKFWIERERAWLDRTAQVK